MDCSVSRKDDFWLKYRSALEVHLMGGGDKSLVAALVLGAEGLRLDKDYMSVVETHFEALLDIQGHLGPENSERARRFLHQALFPYQVVPQSQRASIPEFTVDEKIRPIGDLVSRIVHEFNNLMTIVRGFAQIASGKMEESSPGLSEMKEIAIVSERAERIANELVVFNRTHLENQEWIDLNECVREFLERFVKLAGHGYSISVELAEELWRIRAHPEQVRRILMHLFLDVGGAMSSEGEILVRTENHRAGFLGGREKNFGAEHYVCFSIEDHGPERTSAPGERAPGGSVASGPLSKRTSLGMAIVNGILSILGGWSEVESQPEKRKIIRVFLPAWPAGQSIAPGTLRDSEKMC